MLFKARYQRQLDEQWGEGYADGYMRRPQDPAVTFAWVPGLSYAYRCGWHEGRYDWEGEKRPLRFRRDGTVTRGSGAAPVSKESTE